jgi:hypothetical protein
MLINLWVRDKRDGHIHQVGTDVHDSVEYLCGEVVYVNMQSTASTLDEYEWVEPPDVDDYVSVSPDELLLNRELIHKDVHKILSGIYTPEERETIVQNKLKELFPFDDSFGGLADE